MRILRRLLRRYSRRNAFENGREWAYVHLILTGRTGYHCYECHFGTIRLEITAKLPEGWETETVEHLSRTLLELAP